MAKYSDFSINTHETLESMLGLGSIRENEIINAPVDQIFPYGKGNLFHVNEDDEDMQATLDSFDICGPIEIGITRPRPGGGYELLSGERRWRAHKIKGLKYMQIVCRNYTDEEAHNIMIHANVRRSVTYSSELAHISRNMLDNLSHQGKVSTDGKSASKVGRRTGKSARSVYRYARLTHLIPELLKCVDEKKLSVTVAEQISFTSQNAQLWLYQYITKYKVKLNLEQANKIKVLDEDACLTEEKLQEILFTVPVVKKDKRHITFETELLSYFPLEYTEEDIRIVVLSLVRKWQNSRKEEQ